MSTFWGGKKMATGRPGISRQALSRREVLKALGAIGGAAATSLLLPERWVKPVVEAGVVPAHAQSSAPNPAYRIRQCDDYQTHWYTEPALTLTIVSMAILSSATVGVPMVFSCVLKDINSVTVYSSGKQVFLTQSFGDATAVLAIPFSQLSGIPWGGYAHWEFSDPRDGQNTCDWYFGIEPAPLLPILIRKDHVD